MRYLIFILIFFLSGCISSPKYSPTGIYEKWKQDIISKDLTQKKKYIIQHPNLSKKIQDNILTYKISEEMTKEDVVITWGEPHAERQSIYLNKSCDIWYYGFFVDNLKNFSYFNLYFIGDVLVHSVQNKIEEFIYDKIEEFKGLNNIQKACMIAKEQQEFDIRQEYIRQHPQLSNQIKEVILKKQILIGMSKDDVLATWGEPLHINKTVAQNFTQEQWVYGNIYLYFMDDKLESFQTFK